MMPLHLITRTLHELNMQLVKEYNYDGYHFIETGIHAHNQRPGENTPTEIVIQGIKFVYQYDASIPYHLQDHIMEAFTYKCVFSNEVLQNSVGIEFGEVE